MDLGRGRVYADRDAATRDCGDEEIVFRAVRGGSPYYVVDRNVKSARITLSRHMGDTFEALDREPAPNLWARIESLTDEEVTELMDRLTA